MYLGCVDLGPGGGGTYAGPLPVRAHFDTHHLATHRPAGWGTFKKGPRGPLKRAGFPMFLPGNRPRDPLRSTGRPPHINLHQKSAPETNSKAISCEFLGFRPEIDPGTPLDRRGLPGTSICTKNQPRRPILRPFLKKIPKNQKKSKKSFKSL